MSVEEIAKKLDVTIEKVKRVGEAFISLIAGVMAASV